MRDQRRLPFHFMRRQGLNTAGGDGPPTWGGVIGVLSDQTDLQTALDNKVNVGDDPYPQVANHAALPSAAANTGEIYIVQTTTGLIGLRKLAGLWRSDGATWTYLGLYGRNASEITNVPGVGSSATDVQAAIDEIGGRSTDGWAEGVSNLYFTAARALGSVLTGLSTASSAAVTAADTVLSALGKLQAQITTLASTVVGKEDTGVAASALTAHEAASNPHPTYLTQAEADALYAAAGGGGSGISGVSTLLTYSDAFTIEQTVSAAGVLPSNLILACVAPHDDTDENHETLLNVSVVSAKAGTDQVVFTVTFNEPTRGPVKINWSAI